MPVKDYRAYAASEKGRAARALALARQRYIAKRRETGPVVPSVNFKPLIEAVNHWRAQ